MTKDASPLDKFGRFRAIWGTADRPVAGHLALLGLRDATARIEQIARILKEQDCASDIRTLFDEPNWRPHLVGAVACLIEPETAPVDALWGAIDRGSWVIPQLTVATFFVDPQFPAETRARIEARCPVSIPEALPPDSPDVAVQSPYYMSTQPAKMLASLLTLCERVPALSGWAQDLCTEQDIRDMLKIDEKWNKSPRITSDWFEQIKRLFADRGTPLTPKFVT